MYIRTNMGLGQSADISPTAPVSTGSLFQQIQNALASGQWVLALTLAVLTGLRDENKLTNMIFFARHPELGGRKLTRSDPQSLKDEWVSILQTIVRPMLRRLKEAKSQPSPSSPVLPGPTDAQFPLTELKLATQKIVVARAGDRKKGTAVAIEEAPAVFLPEIIGMARDLAIKDKKNELAGKLDPATWFKKFTRVTFLGRPLRQGQYVHLEMAKLLKSIEAEMVRKYGGDAKSVGDMLLKNSDESIPGSRLVSSTATFSMHMFGLAIDVNYLGNPYIQKRAIPKLNAVLSNAARLMNGPMLVYKNQLGFDRIQEIDTLLEKYFGLLDAPAELERLVQGSSSSDWRGLSAAAARQKIQKHLDDLAPLLARGGKKKEYFKRHGILNFDKRFVVQMEELGLHWGGEYGDMMHFDMRKTGVGFYIQRARMQYAGKVKALARRFFNQKSYGTHPAA